MSIRGKCITVVLAVPEDEAGARALCEAFALYGKVHGGTVTALYAGDAITETELMGRELPKEAVKRIREQAGALAS